MGGEEKADWHLYPENDAILIGTQDMLLSRALNRGYGASRFHWPIDFGLLNNYCLWVFDEPQLMANGVTTSAQLAGLRNSLGTFNNCRSLWMSATLEPSWLATVDFRTASDRRTLSLGQHADGNDLDPSKVLFKRMTATKVLRPLGDVAANDVKNIADSVLNHHIHIGGTQTLIIVNSVDRAKATFEAINKQIKQSGKERLHTLLVHSRFRPSERSFLNSQLQNVDDSMDRIIIATQVVEAGVDLSARTLITELAPWASIVQRIGRCNRTGNDGPGQVYWIDLGEKQMPPYDVADLEFSRKQLMKLEGRDVSPLSLSDFKEAEQISLPFEHTHVLRRRDLLDLFDTAPDLSGNDIDVKRFVRSNDPDIDVSVFWRDTTTVGRYAAPIRRELCSVPGRSFRDFVKAKDKYQILVWDHIDEQWQRIRDVDRDIRPGQTFLIPAKAGGYSEKLGWNPDSGTEVTPLPPENGQPPEAAGSDPYSAINSALTISEHTQNVCDELSVLLKNLPSATVLAGSLQNAARWHDVGKAHWAFQEGMRSCNPDLATNQYWAKSGRNGRIKHGRKHFRHELASALAVLKQEFPFIVAYLVAAHHGRVRLSIRALPGENPLPISDDTQFALGVHDADPLPTVDLGNATRSSEIELDLSPMRLGGKQSWTARALNLLKEFGPFRLAFAEALLRVADVRASQKESLQ